MRSFGLACVVVGLVAALPLTSFAQLSTTGTIEVRVTDESKGVLPGVTLTLTNPTTGFSRNAVSNDRGVFQFLLVPVGDNYELRSELTGFTPEVIRGIRIESGTQMFNISLSVGAVEETVQVAATAPLIDTTSAATTQAMDNTLVEALPLAARNYAEIASHFPAVVHTAADNSATFIQFHVRGQPTTGHGYRVDGADTMTPFLGRTGSTLSPLAIERMEFVSGGMPAEFGEQPGGIFSIITKSGTNSARGGYAGVHRPDALNAKVESGIVGQVVDSVPGNSNLQELALGGPLRRDRVFYFGNYQYRQQDIGNLLSLNMMTGQYHNAHGKVTWVQNDNNSLNVFGDINTVDQENTQLSSTVTAEANTGQKVKIGILSGTQTHQFSPTLVMETQGLFYGLSQTSPVMQPTGNPNVTVVRADGTQVIGQAANFSGWDERRLKATTKITKLFSDHTVKFGLDYSTSWGIRFQEQQVPIFNDRRPIGGVLTKTLNNYNSPASLKDRWFDVFAQDTWAIAPRVTVQYGVRVDYQHIVGDYITQPRVGLAWDVLGDGSNKLSASWGRMHQVIPGSQYTVDMNFLQEQFRVDAPLGSYVGPETRTNQFRTVRVGTQKNPITLAGTVGYERLLPFDTRLTATLAWSDISNRQIATRFTDRVEWFIGGKDKYRGLELSVVKYMTHNFQVMGSYTYSRTEGDFENPLTVAQAPYRYALLDWDSPHVATISGIVRLPWEITFAPVYKFVTGRPYSIDNAQVGTLVTYIDRQGNPAGRNIYRMPDITSFAFAAGRQFRSGRLLFEPQVEMLNAFNRVNVISVNSAFVSAGRPTRVDTGRQIQFGIDIKF